ncbi:MAG: HEAT repeat domain-containing protein [Candidatus Thorarchaeota archaeon]
MSTKTKQPRSLRKWLMIITAIVGIIVMIIGAIISVLVLFIGVIIVSLAFFMWLQGIIGQSKRKKPGRLRLDLLTEHINPYDALEELVDYEEANIGRQELNKEQIREAAQVLHTGRAKDQRTATLRLLMAGAQSIPYIRPNLHSDEPEVLITSLLTLRFFDKDAASVVELATDLLESNIDEVRGYSALLLAKIGPAAKNAVPKLISLLQDPDPSVARDAALALGMIGSKSEDAMKALKEVQGAEDPQLQLFSRIGLARLGTVDEEIVASLTSAVNDRDPMNGIFAIQALGEIGEPAKSAEPIILRLLSHRHPALRLIVGQALYKLHSAPGPIAQALVRNLPLRKAEPFIRRDSFNLLQQIIKDVPEVIPSLTKQVSNRDPVTRVMAARLLAEFGEEAIEAAPALVRMMEDNLMTCQYHARQALEKISPSSQN